MIDPLQMLLEQAADASSPFSENSRYRHVEIAIEETPEGRPIAFVRRRFLPQPEAMATLAHHVIKLGDRLDNLSHHYLQDPERFWQICDANRALRPAELTDDPPQIGPPRVIRIALPPGMSGPTDISEFD